MTSAQVNQTNHDGHIGKRAEEPMRFARRSLPFVNARTAFKAFLLSQGLTPADEVLLPAYIGWSAREGSGVFDPVLETGVKFRFYRLDQRLSIDLEDLRRQLRSARPQLLVLIHYFGFPDRNLTQAVTLAREHEVPILEDEAHALYSDWIGGVCGRFGDAAIMSLHKMLPCRAGGLLLMNPSLDQTVVDELNKSDLQTTLDINPWDYDLFAIAAARRANTARLLELIQPLQGKVEPLFPTLPDGVVPQTLPVIINGRSRDELYFELNARGYGVVSLYHTLIRAISPDVFPELHHLARCVMNLPVHQDIQDGQLEGMTSCLGQLLE